MIDCVQHLSLQMLLFGFCRPLIHFFFFFFFQNLSKAPSFFHQLCSCESFHTIIRPKIPLLLFIRLLRPLHLLTMSLACLMPHNYCCTHNQSSLQKYRHMVPLTNFLSKWLYLVTISLSFSVSGVSQIGLENCK